MQTIRSFPLEDDSRFPAVNAAFVRRSGVHVPLREFINDDINEEEH